MAVVTNAARSLRPAPLEDWLRQRYFSAEFDISSSGVASYSMAEVRSRTGLNLERIDALVFDDGYSLGSPSVRSALAAHLGVSPETVMTTSGSGEAISLVLSALLRPGDEVVVVRPGYHLLTEYALALGAQVRDWHLRPEQDWSASLEDLRALVTPGTRALVVNFPQNPTGSTLTRSEQDQVLDIARAVGAWVLWDGAFTQLSWNGEQLPEVSSRYDRGVGFGTFSKAYGLPGLRFGWCAGPPQVLEACVHLRDYTTLHVAPLVELVAQQVLENAEAFLGPRREQARAGRETVLRWAGENEGLVSLAPPGGGVSAFVQLSGFADTEDFCSELFAKEKTLAIPGSCFGAPQYIRIGFGGQADILAEGLERLGRTLGRWATSPDTGASARRAPQ
jgi:capreomycidine synthase